jgi:hypothetical protein
MPATQNKLSPVIILLIGTILGAGLSYLSGNYLNRLELLRATQRDAYIDFLKAQAGLDLGKEPVEYAAKTTDARKRIAIYGSSDVVEALANYWRSHFDRPMCGGTKEKIHDDLSIFQNMRKDLVPFWQQVSDADMMMLQYLCRVPQ